MFQLHIINTHKLYIYRYLLYITYNIIYILSGLYIIYISLQLLGAKDREMNKIFPYWMLPVNWERDTVNK